MKHVDFHPADLLHFPTIKTIATLSLALALSVTLASCGSSGDSESDGSSAKPPAEFITTWKVSANGSFTIPTNFDFSSDYKYNVDCDNDGTDEFKDKTGDVTCSYTDAGTYTVAISGDFPAISFNGFRHAPKIQTVANWSSSSWKNMDFAFSGAGNLTLTATNAPDLSVVSNMSAMFQGASLFKGNNISSWDVSNVSDMSDMFSFAIAFNQDISGWDVSKVEDMTNMLHFAEAFNQDISGWTVSKVTSCNDVFTTTGMSKENLDKIKSTTVGWLRSVEKGGLPAVSATATCRTTISELS